MCYVIKLKKHSSTIGKSKFRSRYKSAKCNAAEIIFKN